MFHVKHLPTVALDAPNLETARGKPPIGVVGAQPQTILRPRREHSVGFGDTESDQIIYEDSEIPFRPVDDEGFRKRGIETGEKSLGSGFLIARRAVDLPSHEQARDLARLQRRLQFTRIDMVVFDRIAGAQHDCPLQPRNGLQHLLLYFTRKRRGNPVRIDGVIIETLGLEKDLMAIALSKADNLVLD